MAVTWPTELPPPVRVRRRFERGRGGGDLGPVSPRSWPLPGGPTELVEIDWLLTETERARLEQLYVTDLAVTGELQWLTWPAGTTAWYRFAGPPRFRPRAGRALWDASATLVRTA